MLPAAGCAAVGEVSSAARLDELGTSGCELEERRCFWDASGASSGSFCWAM